MGENTHVVSQVVKTTGFRHVEMFRGFIHLEGFQRGALGMSDIQRRQLLALCRDTACWLHFSLQNLPFK